MNRYWFRVELDKRERKVVKVLIQAPDYETANRILKFSIEDHYPGYPDFRILNKRDTLSDESCYVVIGDGEDMHYATLTSKEVFNEDPSN